MAAEVEDTVQLKASSKIIGAQFGPTFAKLYNNQLFSDIIVEYGTVTWYFL
jgi:hypothetical protein